MVQAEVQLHRALRAPELRPREQRQAQVDGRRVERVERVAEPEAVARRGRAAARRQTPAQLLVEPVRLLPVHPRQRRPRYRTDAEVVELAALSRQVRHDVAQAAAPRELRHGHRHELVPARHAAQLPALVVPLREGLELMSRHQPAREPCHCGPWPEHPCFRLVFDKPNSTARSVQATLFSPLCGTAMNGQ